MIDTDPVRVDSPSLIDALCTRCGLCCDGSLFADLELIGRAEVTRVEILGLEIEDQNQNSALLALPCRALQGTRCSIYTHRPKCCRSFECCLLQNVRQGVVSVEQAAGQIADARNRIERVRQLMTQLGPVDPDLPLREACAEVLAGEPGTDSNGSPKRAELEAAMSAVDEILHRTFLGAAESGES